MRKEFFSTAGYLLTVAFGVISLIIGIRAGLMAESIWTGVQTGGGFLLGTALFALGAIYCNKSWFDHPVAKVLFAVSLLGIAVFGVSLAMMMVSDTVALLSVAPAITEWGIKIGSAMFVAPVVLVALYYGVKALVVFIDEHRVFSALTLAAMVAIGVIEYFVAGTLGAGFGAAFGFLFYWASICMFIHAWNAVKSNEGRTYVRIGLALILGYLGSGMLFLLSELLINVPALNQPLVWLAQHIGIPSMIALIGYIVLVVVVLILSHIWKGLLRWATR